LKKDGGIIDGQIVGDRGDGSTYDGDSMATMRLEEKSGIEPATFRHGDDIRVRK
jgi:hypothetical protein